jgi:hypothetical protein
MKDTLEYKILKYLFENDNAELININLLSENKVLLNKSILDLRSKGLINAKKYTSDGYDKYFLCQINFEGKIFFNALKSGNDRRNYHSDFGPYITPLSANLETNLEENQKTRLSTFLSNPWVIGVALALLAAILNGERVVRFINKILNSL